MLARISATIFSFGFRLCDRRGLVATSFELNFTLDEEERELESQPESNSKNRQDG